VILGPWLRRPRIALINRSLTEPIIKRGANLHERTVVDHPDTLWDEFGDVGEIDRESFTRYYESRETGVAFVISWVKKYATPHSLESLESQPSFPQSFSYLVSPVVIAL
jgi:hypothetical protein